MALDPTILRKIRYEIGTSYHTGVDDDATLEVIFNDEDEGNSSVLVTALIVWRRRLAEFTNASYDVTTEGSLMSRSQRIKFIERRIQELENKVETTLTGTNMTVTGSGASSATTTVGLYGGAEL